jgi:hypothetical protein
METIINKPQYIREYKAYRYFEISLVNTKLMYQDKGFQNYIDTFLNQIFDPETMSESMEYACDENTWHQAFYLLYLLTDENNSFLKVYDTASTFLHYEDHFDHYNVLKHFSEIY